MIPEGAQMCYNLKYLACFAVGAAVVTAVTADGVVTANNHLRLETRAFVVFTPNV